MSDLVLKPRMSEKSYALSATGVYVFDVPMTTNKFEIAKAVASIYEVTVENVRIVIVKGKTKNSYRKRKAVKGRRSNIKKAYVTLKKGDAIPIFAAVEEQEEKEEKAQKTIAKVVERSAKKDEKKSSTGRKLISRVAPKKRDVK